MIWTRQALSELGLGSKTALGFGRFCNIKNVTAEKSVRLNEEIKRRKALLQQKREKALKEIEAKRRQKLLAEMGRKKD